MNGEGDLVRFDFGGGVGCVLGQVFFGRRGVGIWGVFWRVLGGGERGLFLCLLAGGISWGVEVNSLYFDV